MTAYLLTVSIALHLVTFLWLIIVMQKLNHQAKQTIDDQRLKAEVEDILLAYTTEMKEENEKFVQAVQQTRTQRPKQEEDKLEQPAVAIKEQQVVDAEVTQNQMGKKSREDHYHEYVPPLEEEQQTVAYEQSDTAKILQLVNKGYTATGIAKELDIGKGEVELILKLYR